MRFPLVQQEPPRRTLTHDDLSRKYDALAAQLRETPGVWYYLNPALEELNGVVSSAKATLKRRGIIITERTIEGNLHFWGMAPDSDAEEE